MTVQKVMLVGSLDTAIGGLSGRLTRTLLIDSLINKVD